MKAPSEGRSPAPPPSAAEADAAVRRVFGAAVRRQDGGGPGLLVADLNGDGSQDLLVVVGLSSDHLAEVNDDLASWLLQDVTISRAGRIQVEPGDLLLAVIPGYGPSGWRNDAARHGYLLRNAVGTEMRRLPLGEVMSAGPDERFAGDAIALTIHGRPGFIFWNGARYLWRAV